MRTDEYRLAIDLVKEGDYDRVCRDLDTELQRPDASVALSLFRNSTTEGTSEVPALAPDDETDSIRWPLHLLRADIELLRGLPELAEAHYASAASTALRECRGDEGEATHWWQVQWLYQFGCEEAWRWVLVTQSPARGSARDFPGEDSWGLHPDDATGLDALSFDAPTGPNQLATTLYASAREAFEAVKEGGDDDQWLLAMHALLWLSEEAEDWWYVLTLATDFWDAWYEDRKFSDADLDRQVACEFAGSGQMAALRLLLLEKEKRQRVRVGTPEFVAACAQVSDQFGQLWALVPAHVQEKIATGEALYRFVKRDTQGFDWSSVSAQSWTATEIYFRDFFLPKIREHSPQDLRDQLVVRHKTPSLYDVCRTLESLAMVNVHTKLRPLLGDVAKIADIIKCWASRRTQFIHFNTQGVEDAQRMHYVLMGDENEPGVIKRMAEIVCRLS